MPSGSRHVSRIALISCCLLWGSPHTTHANPAWVDPPSGPDDAAAREAAGSLRQAQTPMGSASDGNRSARGEAARDLAFTYLELWSAPNRVALASASSFYGPTVTFHGRARTLGSVLAEKRRFAERWPDRNYRYRPGTTQVACEADGNLCTVWSIFDFPLPMRATAAGRPELESISWL